MNIKLVVDDLEIPVGYELLETIADRIGDHEDLQEFYHRMAQHPNPEVRYAVAYYEKLRADTIALLLQDSEVKTIERVLDDNERIAKVDEDEIKRIIVEYKNTDILKAIVNRFEDIDTEEPNSILDLIIENHGDNLELMGTIADSWDTPKHILKKLKKSKDIDIVRKATESLDR
jgi:hypothetical protein